MCRSHNSHSIKRCLTGCPYRVAALKVRQGAFDALNKGSGALRKQSKVVALSGASPEELYDDMK